MKYLRGCEIPFLDLHAYNSCQCIIPTKDVTIGRSESSMTRDSSEIFTGGGGDRGTGGNNGYILNHHWIMFWAGLFIPNGEIWNGLSIPTG